MGDFLRVAVESWYVMAPLFLGSIMALAICIEKAFHLSRAQVDPARLMNKIKEAIRRRDFRVAVGYCEATPGPVAKVLATAIELRTLPDEQIKQGVEESVLTEIPRLERFLPTLSTIVTLAPLLGLLGTITGLMKVFAKFAYEANPNPAMLAGGIKEALYTTAVGLAIAIAFYFLHNVLSTRIDSLINQMEKSVVELLNFMRMEGANDAELQATQQN